MWGSDGTGMRGGRPSDGLMKTNGEHLGYQHRAGGRRPGLGEVMESHRFICQCHIWAKSEQSCSRFSQMDRSTLIFMALVGHLFDAFPLTRQ